MNNQISVVLTGFPERVQRIADAIDKQLPGEIVWDDATDLCPEGVIILIGRAAPPAEISTIDVAA